MGVLWACFGEVVARLVEVRGYAGLFVGGVSESFSCMHVLYQFK